IRSPSFQVKSDYEEISGYNYLYYLPDMTETEEWQSNEPIQLVMIYADLDYFRAFDLGCEFPALLQQILKGDVRRFHQSLGKTTRQMKQILQQLLHCHYQGLTRQLYLESKALELLSLQFAQWSDSVRSPQPIKFRSDDIDRLHHAKEILIENFNHPPSLMDLARQVGLNERKLKQGFQQIFGTTVFGYLQTYRMQQAQQLLRDSNVTIASVAAAVGYRNSEAFSVAFQRQFAINPKAYQLGKLS
ncbi:MAG: helix-turn-helix transcriptional regulator, partial [Microcoleus sp. SIO2G3]|nr:helix-turn-helix transcriptional regulator [Microcoleus sp. SIO2G3]